MVLCFLCFISRLIVLLWVNTFFLNPTFKHKHEHEKLNIGNTKRWKYDDWNVGQLINSITILNLKSLPIVNELQQ